MTPTSVKQKSATPHSTMMMTLAIVFVVVTVVFLMQTMMPLVFSGSRNVVDSSIPHASRSSGRLIRLGVSQQQQQRHNSLLTLQESIDNLRKAGFDLCLDLKEDDQNSKDVDVLGLFQRCTDFDSMEASTLLNRRLALMEGEENEDDRVDEKEDAKSNESSSSSAKGFIVNIIGALICVSMAALAAGLTLGLLGLDPLLLLIKQRASENEKERIAAADLLPIVKDHHRLLVTLLLLNAVSNEALPIFLEGLHLAPWVAIMISVTLVLFFGEIFPSAIFTGPHQMTIAHSLLPLVKGAMFMLYPFAMPIAHLLDRWLHHDGDGDDDQADGDAYYNRGELSAMIRILYEERLEAKRKRKEHRREVQRLQQEQQQQQRDGGGFFIQGDHVGALDFPMNNGGTDSHRDSIRAAISHVQHITTTTTNNGSFSNASINADDDHSQTKGAKQKYEQPNVERSNSIHVDEVMMVEGALQMKTKVALDVFTPRRHVYCIPDTTILSESTVVNIYASGYSRIPVYHAENGKTAVIGVLITKQLIVLNPNDERPITSMPLYTPLCISPDTSLVDVLNIFQTGGSRAMKGGHMCLICARPRVGNQALSSSSQHHGATETADTSQRPMGLPKEAGFMGIITLEDVLEALLQEQIYDEYDKIERNARTRLAEMVIAKWRRFVRRRKKQRGITESSNQFAPIIEGPAMLQVVEEAMTAAAKWQSNPDAVMATVADETTSLLEHGH